MTMSITITMILMSLVLLICIFSTKALYKFGVPSLLIFMILGMLFGSEGIVGIQFSDYNLAGKVGSFALLFIMFYGGFCTNWKMAKPEFPKALLMSTVGVIITSVVTGLFCTLVLKVTILEGLLVGAVVASTDAASVFSILRSQKLNLKGGLASILEVESGSNDPCAYLITITLLTLMSGGNSGSLLKTVVFQIVFGVLVGFILSKIGAYILKNIKFEIEGLYPIFVIAIAILSYSLSEWLGGNEYLSVYIAGIIMGNSKIHNKKSLVKFFDGISWLMQITLFFMLGLLSFPSQLKYVAVPGFLISIFLIVVARPISTFAVLTPFKVPIKQQLFISWVGLRGAASIVFAILAVTHKAFLESDIFHIVFFIALFSVSIQGTLIATIARKLDLVDDETIVLKTFNDYQDEMSTQLFEKQVTEESKCANKTIMDAIFQTEVLVVMIKRDGKILHPKGATMIKAGDTLVLAGDSFDSVPI